MPDITIVGCGVIGLTTGIRLLSREQPYSISIVAKDLPPQTTSNRAAAIWLPFQVASMDQVVRWAGQTYEVYGRQIEYGQKGIFWTELWDLFEAPGPDPEWVSAVPKFRQLSRDELPPGCARGIAASVPVIDTSIYMEELVRTFEGLGGMIQQRDLAALSDVAHDTKVIVNCTGLGAKALLNDHEMFPVRGQVVRVECQEVNRAMSLIRPSQDVSYVVPRSKDVILGGTTYENDWNEEIDAGDSQGILERAKRLEPALENMKVLDESVGLRPGRSAIRLELEQPEGQVPVIHNYGHGGAGFTVCWGCADDVSRMLERIDL